MPTDSLPGATRTALKARLKAQKTAEDLAVAQEKARLKIEIAQGKAKAEVEVLQEKAKLKATAKKAEPRAETEQDAIVAEHAAAIKDAYRIYMKRCEEKKRIELEQSLLTKEAYDAWEKLKAMTPKQYIEGMFNNTMEEQKARLNREQRELTQE
jgi:hypothetical protein